jgi:hypothetical protein
VDRKAQHQCHTSSIVIAQLAFWVRTKRGKQRMALQKWLTELVEAMTSLASRCPMRRQKNSPGRAAPQLGALR